MPLYPFFCETDGDFDVIREIEGQKVEATCPACGQMGRRKWTPVKHFMSFQDGFDSSVQQHFNSQRERDNYLAEHHLERIKD